MTMVKATKKTSSKTENQPSNEAMKLYQKCLVALKGRNIARIVWFDILTEEERRRLGNNLGKAFLKYQKQDGVVGIWRELHQISHPHAVVDLGRRIKAIDSDDRLLLLKEFGIVSTELSETIASAVASGDLVLIQNPRLVYWKKVELDCDWHKRNVLWDFFVLMCKAATKRKGIDNMDFGDDFGSNVIADRKNKLKDLRGFPSDLHDLIQKDGRGTQKMKLPRERIHLFEQIDDE